MRTYSVSIGILRVSVLLASSLWAGNVLADVSPSYQLVSDFPNAATNNGGASTSFTLSEGQLTWTQKPITSTNFQIVPPGGSAISTSASSASSEGTGGSAASTPRGSRGDRAGTTGGVASSRSSSSSSPVSSLSSSSSSISSSSSSINSAHGAAPEEIVTPGAPITVTPVPLSEKIADEFFCGTDNTEQVSFFGAQENICAMHAAAGAYGIHISLLLLWLLLILVLLCIGLCAHLAARKKKDGLTKLILRTVGYVSHLLAAFLILLVITGIVHAAQTTPNKHIYNGRLLDSGGNAITTSTSIRFSYWKSADYVTTDTTATGAINTGAANYASWNEVHTVTPNSSGYFSVTLGSGTTLPSFASLPTQTLLSLYLQVEAKAAASADTAYELLDPDSTDTTIDRSGVLSVPFAQNADMIDQREVGTASGSIALLGSGGLLPVAHIPSGTNRGGFSIDADGTETSQISLTFGSALGKKLTYDLVNTVFRFNDDLEVQGNLTVTGLINGIDVASFQTSTGALKAFSGGGLNLHVSRGSYRLAGTITNYGGGTITLTASTTNYVFFGSGGLTKNLTGFPSDESYIPVASVLTSGGGITIVTDLRALSSDDREHDTTLTFTPAFEKAAYQGDATDNVGQLSVQHDSISTKNYYNWSSTRTSLQDFDVLLRIPVTQDFVRFQTGNTNALTLLYRSTSASATDNKLDIQVYDTNGSPVTLSGSVTGLVNTSWTTAQVEFTGSPTWTPGQDMLIRIKTYAKDSFQMHIGTLKLNVTELLGL